MAYTYEQRKRPQGAQSHSREPAPGPAMDALMTGAARPTAAQKGRQIDLDGAMRAKMEHAFGDLSAVKLYESRAVGDAGAEAIAQGNEIAFAPGMANFSTRSGQERLGHELSHVMSQRSGAVRGRGFLANSALEDRADREGAMAAAGEQVYTGPVTHALSSASPSPSVAGPMQASRGDEPDEPGPILAPARDIQSPVVAHAPAAQAQPAVPKGHQLDVGSMEANKRAYRKDEAYQNILGLMRQYNGIDEAANAQAKDQAEIALSRAAMDYIERASGGKRAKNKGRTAKLENMLYQLSMRGGVKHRANENLGALREASRKSGADQALKNGADQTFQHLRNVYNDPKAGYSPTMQMITAGVLADQNVGGASEPEFEPVATQSAAEVMFGNGSTGYGDNHNYIIQGRAGTDVNDSAGTTLHELTHVATGEVYNNSSGMLAIGKNATDQEVLDKYRQRVKTVEGLYDALQTNKHGVKGVAGNRPGAVLSVSNFAKDKLQYAARNTTTRTAKRQDANHYRAFMNPILRAEAEEKNQRFNPQQIAESNYDKGALQPYMDVKDPATQDYLRGQGPKPAGMPEKVNLTDEQKQTFKTNMEMTQKLKDYDDLIDRNKGQNQDTINAVRKIETGNTDQLVDPKKTGANVLTEYDTVMNQMLLQYENAGQRNNTPDKDSLFYRRLRNAALRAHLERREHKLKKRNGLV